MNLNSESTSQKTAALPVDLTTTYEGLMVEGGEPFSHGQPCPQATSRAMDRWIQAYLEFRDDTGRPLPLNALFKHVSRFNAAITTQIIQESISCLETRGKMQPPLPFCWISMGSDARDEQVVRTDQDNALVYADPLPGKQKKADIYFKALAQEVTQALDRFGFKLCPGNVMATNPEWRRPLSRWLSALDNWVGATEPVAVRMLTILLDFKPVFGDNRLSCALQTRVFKNFKRHGSASHFLVRDDQLFAPPKTAFNRIRIRREKGFPRCFNLKTQAIAHIVNGARLFAVNHGIQTPSTLKRLARLRDEGVLTWEECDDYTQAFIHLTRLKLTVHLANNQPTLPTNCIDISTLSTGNRNKLKRALNAVTRFQKKMTVTYNQPWMNFFN